MYEIKTLLKMIFEDCAAYWQTFHKTGMVWGGVFALLYSIAVSRELIHRQENFWPRLGRSFVKIPFAFLLGFYSCLVLEITVFSRSAGEVRILRLAPFATWGTDFWHLTLWLENILMMVPLGILLYILWEPFRKIGRSMLAGSLFSLLIECTQLLGRLGKFETDDIMNNVFGTLLGFLLCKGIGRVSCALYAHFRRKTMMNVKKKILITLLMSAILLCSACGGREEGHGGERTPKEAEETSPLMEGSIEVLEELPDREIKIPDYLTEGQEENSDDETCGSEKGPGEKAGLLSGEEQAEKARQVAAQIEESVNQVLSDKDFYPHVIGIFVNPECTQFNVTFSGRELSLYENTLPMSLCIVGDRFQLYQGKQENELMTVVNYIDGDSGEIFNSVNSQEIK